MAATGHGATPRQLATVSLPLEMVCTLSLLHRAVPESHFDPWLVETRDKLSPSLRETLDLLHGFSGRLLYYMEEPVLAFRPLDADRADASFETFVAFLLTVPAAEYQAMVERAVARVHADLGLAAPAIDRADADSWRAALEPCLTTATMDEALDLATHPARLKRLTIDLFTGVWEEGFGEEYEATLPTLRDAARLADPFLRREFGEAFYALTGQKPPDELVARLPDVTRIGYCPSDYLGSDISFILAPPDLVVDYGAPEFLERVATGATPTLHGTNPAAFSDGALLEISRALADPTRLRILQFLAEGERYAQEIVLHVGIAQSAVSRHLSQLERAGLIGVSPRKGQKFYSVQVETLDSLAVTFTEKASRMRRPSG